MKSMEKRFQCGCGKSYYKNSSLYNHIRLKHENKRLEYNISQTAVGRPQGQRNKIKEGEQIKIRTPAKLLLCSCGKTLKGEGSLSNHIRIIHGNDPFYQIQKKKQGRKKRAEESNENINTTALYQYNTQTSEQYNMNTEIQVGQLNNQENQYENQYTFGSTQITNNQYENEEPLNSFNNCYYDPKYWQSYDYENFFWDNDRKNSSCIQE
ncbi:hypothetical protein ABPG74_009795 [Tetrahymena malaccensis]